MLDKNIAISLVGDHSVDFSWKIKSREDFSVKNEKVAVIKCHKKAHFSKSMYMLKILGRLPWFQRISIIYIS